MASEEERPAFRVIDRRRFAPDGSERPETSDAPEEKRETPQAGVSGAASSGPSTAAPAGEPAGAARQAAQSAGAQGLGMPIGNAYGDEESAPVEPSFSTLIISLSTQALMLLGEIADPSSGEQQRDLPAARHLIDLLAVLQRKTTGNLDSAESALLERILYDLRMRFVDIARG